MEEMLKQILSKLDAMDKGNKEFREEVNQRFNQVDERFNQIDAKLHDLDNRSEILLSDIQGVSKKLDRQIASSRSNSVKLRELEMRVEDLEVSPPVK